MARFDGRVHGVVVQMTTEAPSAAFSFVETTGNLIHTVMDLCSLYSTSASASAVFSTTDHSTGFAPLYNKPFFRNLWISRTILPSDRSCRVKYGFFQSAATPRRWNSPDWISTHLRAKARHSSRKASFS